MRRWLKSSDVRTDFESVTGPIQLRVIGSTWRRVSLDLWIVLPHWTMRAVILS